MLTRVNHSALNGAGVHLLSGSVTRSTLVDIGAGGLLLGSAARAALPQRARVHGNLVARTGREFAGSVGIWGGYVHQSSITENMVADLASLELPGDELMAKSELIQSRGAAGEYRRERLVS